MFTQKARHLILLLGSLWLNAALLTVSGCTDSVSADARAARQKYLAEKMPTGEVAVSSIREKMKAGELSAGTPFVVRARINAGEMPPWGTGTASFVITDATGHDGDEEHNPHACPFCSRNIQESMAQVHFLDESGTLINSDSRELFDLIENQLVIIQGTGRIDESDVLVIDAQQMYVQR